MWPKKFNNKSSLAPECEHILWVFTKTVEPKTYLDIIGGASAASILDSIDNFFFLSFQKKKKRMIVKNLRVAENLNKSLFKMATLIKSYTITAM
jgi:hypothetical protein